MKEVPASEEDEKHDDDSHGVGFQGAPPRDGGYHAPSSCNPLQFIYSFADRGLGSAPQSERVPDFRNPFGGDDDDWNLD
jgi:hypothetical protein